MELKPGQDVMQMTARISAVEGDGEPQPAELAKYRVQLTAAGQIKRGFDWDLSVPEAVLKRDYKQFNNVGAYVNAQGNHVPSFLQSMQDKVGYFRRAKWNGESKTIDGDLVLARTPNAEAFKAQLDLDLASNNSMVQFSAVYSYDFTEKETKRNGDTYYIVEVDKIREVFSVDAVDRGAFPMRPLEQLAALSEWRGDSSKEDSMAKEVDVALDEQETQKPADKGADERIATLRADYDALQKRDAERDAAFKAQEAALEELRKRDEERDAQVAELAKAAARTANEAHFASKVATLPADDPGVAKLREALDFGAVDTAGIDALVDPVIASLTAAGRAELEPERIKVTQDQADTRTALLTASVLGEEYKDEGRDKPFEVLPVEHIVGDMFGDIAAKHSPQQFWDALNQAYLKHGLTDAEVDADAAGSKVAKLNISTSDSWGDTLIQVITNVARILHDGSEMTGWMNLLIPAMHRVTVPDFNDRHYRYTGTFDQLATVDEGAQVPDVATSDSFRVPVKPIKKQGKFYLTYEAVMNSPTAALRSLAQAMGISISSTDYHEVMNLILGTGVPGTNAPDKTLGYESATKDATVDFISAAAGTANLTAGADIAFSYTNAVNAVDKMYEQVAYGEDAFALAGMIRAATLVVAPKFWGSAEAITRATLEPGGDQNDVNRLQNFNVLPISTSDYNATNVARVFAVVCRPADAQLLVMSTLNGQPPAFQPNVLRDDNANRNRITYKASHIRRFNVVDKRALQVVQSTNDRSAPSGG